MKLFKKKGNKPNQQVQGKAGVAALPAETSNSDNQQQLKDVSALTGIELLEEVEPQDLLALMLPRAVKYREERLLALASEEKEIDQTLNELYVWRDDSLTRPNPAEESR